MKLPIQYAMLYPERQANEGIPRLDISQAMAMTFEPMDPALYPCFPLALEAGRRGGTYPAVLCASDEVAVEHFLEGRLAFTQIPKVVEGVLERHEGASADNLEDILEADQWARTAAREMAASLQ